ncbi:hypothetical protein ANO11243_061440 [Dothideomycetidae sp. 11243]|nr:hypothetical protein ANO11243_061440 [fungal sp. No.11243]
MARLIVLVLTLWTFLLSPCLALADKRSSCQSLQAEAQVLKRNFREPVRFCAWYTKYRRTYSPVPVLTEQQLFNLCQCVEATPRLVLSQTAGFAPQATLPARLEKVARDVANPLAFCAFWGKFSRTSQGSPFTDLDAPAVSSACSVILATPTLVKPTPKPSNTGRATTSFVRKSSTTNQPASFPLSHSMTAKGPSSASPAPTASLIPAVNLALDRSNPRNLIPSKHLALYFAETAQGMRRRASTNASIAIINFAMYNSAIDLENSTAITNVTCTSNGVHGSTLSFTLANTPAARKAVEAWPQRNLVLVTYSCSCNPATQRGIYISSGWTLTNNHVYTFKVTASNWTTVAETMKVSYGSSSDTVAQAPKCPGQSSSTTARATSALTTRSSAKGASASKTSSKTSTTSTKFVMPTAIDDLSPAAQSLLLKVLSDFHYAGPGTVLMSMPPATSTISMPSLSPNATLSPAIEAALEAAGLDPPGKIAADIVAAMGATCGSNGIGNLDPDDSFSGGNGTSLRKRDNQDDWELGGEIASDLCKVAVIIGSKGEEDGDECEGLEDAAALAGCIANGCFNQQTTTIYTTTTVITGYDYTFDSTWTGAGTSFDANEAVLDFGGGNQLICVNCALDMSKIIIWGDMSLVLATNTLTSGTMHVSESTSADMVMRLKTNFPLAYQWDAAVSTINLGAATIESLLNINPTVTVAFGAQFSTNTAIDFTAGASLNWPNASVDVNIGAQSVSNMRGWQPSIDVTYPTFSSDSAVSLYPYIRRSYSIDFEFIGSAQGERGLSLTFASQSTMGFNATFLNAPAGTCAANQLRLISYAGNTALATLPSLSLLVKTPRTVLLNNQAGLNPEKCFNIPAQIPSSADMSYLSSSAQAFCTSYIGYVPPTVGVYTSAMSTVSATDYFTSTSTVVSTPTVTATATTHSNITYIRPTSSYVLQSVTGAQVLASQYLRRDVPEYQPQMAFGGMYPVTVAEEMTAVELRKRSVPTPALITNWPATEIAYACSRIATGTVTSTLTTSTSTVTSGTVNITSTSYVPAVGTPYTTTTTSTIYSWSTSNTNIATPTLDAACPIQTQESCFTITGHGRPNIEGRQLGLYSTIDTPSFNIPATTFYIDCDNQLVSLPDLRVLGASNSSNFLSFGTWNNIVHPATCTKDTVQKTITCSVQGSNLMWIPEFEEYWLDNYWEVLPRDDPRLFMPMWTPSDAVVTTNNTMQSFPMTLSYDDTACACGTPAGVTVDTYNVQEPTCPGADSTTFMTSNGDMWQTQCYTDYCCVSTTHAAAATLLDCIELCNQQDWCYGVSYVPAWTNNACNLKNSVGPPQRNTFDATDYSINVISAFRLTKNQLPSYP